MATETTKKRVNQHSEPPTENKNIITWSDDNFKIFGDTNAFEHMIDLSRSSVIECIDSYIQNRARDKARTEKRYHQIKNHIINIQNENGITLYPLVVGDMFWKQFQFYLIRRGLAPATINHNCGMLHAVLEWAARYGARVSVTLGDYQLQKGKGAPAKPKISLTQDEVSRITYFDIDSLPYKKCFRNTLKKVRDQFVLACFLGQRYSDVRRIDADCFSGDVFSIIQQKTGNKAVVDIKKLAVYPHVVKAILERYDYKAPYPNDISVYNKHLHTLFREAGFTEEIKYEYKVNGVIKQKTFKKYQLISSHTARRTMITNAIQRGLHNEEVRRASGHKSDASFHGYICWNDN